MTPPGFSSLLRVAVGEGVKRQTDYGYAHEFEVSMTNLLSQMSVGWTWKEKGRKSPSASNPSGILSPRQSRRLKLIFEDTLTAEGEYTGPQTLVLRTMLILHPEKPSSRAAKSTWPEYLTEIIIVDVHPEVHEPRVLYRSLEKAPKDVRELLINDYRRVAAEVPELIGENISYLERIAEWELGYKDTSIPWHSITQDVRTVLFAPLTALCAIYAAMVPEFKPRRSPDPPPVRYPFDSDDEQDLRARRYTSSSGRRIARQPRPSASSGRSWGIINS